MDYQGKALEDLSFRVRLSFVKAGTTQAPEGAQQALEYAYLNHKMSDFFSLTIGKFNTEFGGFEGAANGADLYLTSEYYTRTGPNGALAANVLGTKDLLYMTGVKATFSFEGQQVHLMGTNEASDGTSAGPTGTQNSQLYGIDWKGAFLEKALNFNLSYHTMAGPTKDDKHQFVAAGVMWNSSPVMASVEYLSTEFKSDAAGKTDSLHSIVGKIAYTGMDQWTPRVEVISTEEKLEIAGAGTNKYMGFGVVAEYKPYTDTNFRYHIAYSNVKETPEAGDDITKQEVVLGARLYADFLK